MLCKTQKKTEFGVNIRIPSFYFVGLLCIGPKKNLYFFADDDFPLVKSREKREVSFRKIQLCVRIRKWA